MGTIGLPDIQRPFVWKDTKVRDLFDSLYKGYPVGYFLFGENANIDGVKGIGTDVKQIFVKYYIDNRNVSDYLLFFSHLKREYRKSNSTL